MSGFFYKEALQQNTSDWKNLSLIKSTQKVSKGLCMNLILLEITPSCRGLFIEKCLRITERIMCLLEPPKS